MRRLAVLFAIVVVVLSALMVGGWVPSSTAQDTSSDAASHPVLGSWRVTSFEEGTPSLELVDAFMSDGIVFGSTAPAVEIEPDFVILYGTAIGAWEPAGPMAAAYSLDVLVASPSGDFLGRVAIDGIRTVSDDGQTMTGEYVYNVIDPTGAVFASGVGTEEGTRIAVEPMVVPDATPTVPDATPTA